LTKYLSVQEYRDFTNLQDSEYTDTQLGSIINSIESWFDNEITNHILYDHDAVTEYRQGNGTDEIYTNYYPVQEFESVGIDDNDDGSFTNIDLTDMCTNTDTGQILLNGDADVSTFRKSWNKKNNIKIVYTPGVSEVPQFVKSLIVRAVANMLNKQPLNTGIEDEIDGLKDRGISMCLY
jgi:hypothetical protein